MEKKQLNYDAFISYRHNDLDKFVAVNLHKLLESYKLPKFVIKANKLEKTRINRVFRDQEELPLASSLEDPIVEALEHSGYLIVICSPRLKDSMWCKKEIETFIKLNGVNKVLAVLVEGEPSESFPPELLSREVIKNGKKVNEKIEPLAADVRGKNKKEVLKNLKGELLRLLAPMFNLNYDDLKRRHHEQKVKKIIITSIIGSILLLLVSIYMAANFIIIKKQQKEVLTLWSIKLAEQSGSYLKNDNRNMAVKSAYQALTKYNGMKMPYTAEAENALATALDIYNVGNSIGAIKSINTLGIVESIKISRDGNYLLINDSSNTLTLYNLKKDKIIKQIKDLSSDFDENSYTFVENNFAYITNKKQVKIISNTGKVIKTIDEKPYYIYGGEKTLSLVDYNSIKTYDENYKVIYDEKLGEEKKFSGIVYYSTNDKYMIYSVIDSIIFSEKPKVAMDLYIVNLSNKVVNKVNLKTNYLTNIQFNKETMYVLSNASEVATQDYTLNITSINMSNGNINWDINKKDRFATILRLSDNGNYLYYASGFSGYLISSSNGSEVESTSVGETVVAVFKMVDTDNFFLIGERGKQYTINSKTGDSIEYVNQYYFNGDGYVNFEPSNVGLIGYLYNDNRVIIYNNNDNNNFEEIDNYKYLGKTLIDSKIRENCDKYATIKKNIANGFAYDEKKKHIFITYSDNTLEVYDTKTKKLINTNNVLSDINNYLGTDKNGNTYINGDYYGYVLNKDYEIIRTIPRLVGLNKKENKIIVYNMHYYQTDIKSLDDLIKMAKK